MATKPNDSNNIPALLISKSECDSGRKWQIVGRMAYTYCKVARFYTEMSEVHVIKGKSLFAKRNCDMAFLSGF